jgi:effector-binding domain-containing protein
MKQRSVGTICAAVLLAGLASGAFAAPRDLTVAIKQVEPFPYCAISHKGPYADMTTVIGDLVGAMEAQGLLARIRGPLVGVYYNSPGDTAPGDLSWEAGFIVEAQTTARPPLMIKVWDHRTVAAATHVGPYEEGGAAIEKIMTWLTAQGYEADGPILERYLDRDPQAVKPEELRTEIWVPCRKK